MRWVSNRPRPRSGTAQVRPVKSRREDGLECWGEKGGGKEGLF